MHVQIMKYKLCKFGELNALISAFKSRILGNSLAVQWLELLTSTAGGTGLIPGQGTKILQAMWHGHKIN